jgi:TctA family transporter
MIGALLIQGLVPGPNILVQQPSLFWGLVTSMWIGNAMLLVLNLPLIRIWVYLLRVPYYLLFPAIIVFSSIGVYTVNNSVVELYSLAAFGLLGYLIYKLGCEPAPLLLQHRTEDEAEQQRRRPPRAGTGAAGADRASPGGRQAQGSLCRRGLIEPSRSRSRPSFLPAIMRP